MGKQRPAKVGNLSKVTQLVNAKAGLQIQAVWLQAPCFQYLCSTTWSWCFFVSVGPCGWGGRNYDSHLGLSKSWNPSSRESQIHRDGAVRERESGNLACGAELREDPVGFKGTQRWGCRLRSERAGFEVLIVPILSFAVPFTFGGKAHYSTVPIPSSRW